MASLSLPKLSQSSGYFFRPPRISFSLTLDFWKIFLKYWYSAHSAIVKMKMCYFRYSLQKFFFVFRQQLNREISFNFFDFWKSVFIIFKRLNYFLHCLHHVIFFLLVLFVWYDDTLVSPQTLLKGCDGIGNALWVVLPWYLSLGVVIGLVIASRNVISSLMLLQAYSLVIIGCKCVGLLSGGIMWFLPLQQQRKMWKVVIGVGLCLDWLVNGWLLLLLITRLMFNGWYCCFTSRMGVVECIDVHSLLLGCFQSIYHIVYDKVLLSSLYDELWVDLIISHLNDWSYSMFFISLLPYYIYWPVVMILTLKKGGGI